MSARSPSTWLLWKHPPRLSLRRRGWTRRLLSSSAFQGRIEARNLEEANGHGRYAFLKDYDICKWSGVLGPKLKEGDRQAPEGFYTIRPAQMNPNSSYHLSFNMGYPNEYDRAHGAPAPT
jgi:hypothetical protein